MKKIFIFVCFWCFLMLIFSFFKLEENNFHYETSPSLIGLTINGSPATTFPNKESGYAIGSISCDKGANGVWDYELWTLKIGNIIESRTKCQINFVSKYTESILNGTDPVLKDGLIPVIIDNDGTVKKTSLGREWYDYETRRWANAVILNNETEVYYDGEEIPEEAIESYFVWIPRYKYKIFDMGNYTGLTSVSNKQQTIEVIFGTDTTSDTSSSCRTPNQSGASGTCSVGKYMTHPAFTSFGTNGMWVGKFETGYKGASTASEAQKNENNSSKIQIKPNVYSWRSIQVANAYLNSYAYQREMDSHMMKNTEWGAVAYLQHSKYGSGTSVRINNNSDYKTGYGAVHEPTTGYTGTSTSCSTTPNACNEYGTSNEVTRPWNTDIGYLASTTGNISGIYDMSGGSREYVMGVMNSANNELCSGKDSVNHSGFNGIYCGSSGTLSDGISFPLSKFYETYPYQMNEGGNHRRILGDATGEMGPFATKLYGEKSVRISSWYEDDSYFLTSWAPWFSRGGSFSMGTPAGIFSFYYVHGGASFDYGYRIVLSV